MSVGFTVVCRRPRPTDWAEGFEAEDFPFDAWLDEPEGDGAFLLRFNCRPAASELVALCAQAVVDRFGGFYYDDVSDEQSDEVPGVESATGAEVVARWRTLVDDLKHRAHDAAEQRRREYEAARAADPEAFDEADDWSDV